MQSWLDHPQNKCVHLKETSEMYSNSMETVLVGGCRFPMLFCIHTIRFSSFGSMRYSFGVHSKYWRAKRAFPYQFFFFCVFESISRSIIYFYRQWNQVKYSIFAPISSAYKNKSDYSRRRERLFLKNANAHWRLNWRTTIVSKSFRISVRMN